ncbi:MAG: hypothetical protein ACI9MR_000359 [Myxococcota bacterium]|jgi:hypothetical protein
MNAQLSSLLTIIALAGSGCIDAGSAQHADTQDTADTAADTWADTDGDLPMDDAGGPLVGCPEPPPDDVDLSRFGVCDGAYLEGTLTQVQSDALVRRVWHEAMHVAGSVGQAEPSGLFGPGSPSAGVLGVLDHGYAIAAVAVSGPREVSSVCVTIQFRCWTGGHGGWGFSALNGVGRVMIVGTDGSGLLSVDGLFGLLEAGPLMGTPETRVTLEADLAETPVTPLGAAGPFAVE